MVDNRAQDKDAFAFNMKVTFHGEQLRQSVRSYDGRRGGCPTAGKREGEAVQALEVHAWHVSQAEGQTSLDTVAWAHEDLVGQAVAVGIETGRRHRCAGVFIQ